MARTFIAFNGRNEQSLLDFTRLVCCSDCSNHDFFRVGSVSPSGVLWFAVGNRFSRPQHILSLQTCFSLQLVLNPPAIRHSRCRTHQCD